MNLLLESLASFARQLDSSVGAAFDVWFIVFPPLLYFVFRTLWEKYAEGKFASTLKWTLLEIIPPKDIEMSPLPMESIFAGLAGVVKGSNAYEEFVKGEFPVSFSLELASIEGSVHFYVRTQQQFRNLVEAHFYSQYPNIEVAEVPDYVLFLPKSIPNKDWDLWGTDLELTKPDLYPIKTYRSFEEDVTGKMVDPLAGVIESLGKLGPGQHMWFQIVATPQNEKWYNTGKATVDEFLGRVKESRPGVFSRLFSEIFDILGNITTGMLGGELSFSAAAEAEKKEEQPVEFRLTPGEKDVLKALQMNLGKQMFKVRMRLLYMGRREGFSRANISAFMGGLKQFQDQNLNGFKPNDDSKTYANYLFVNERLRYRQRKLYRRYMTRDTDPQKTRFLLSSEELATVYHIPDMQVIAPSLTRVTAKRGSAPANLPVE
jgi:hypothetical protein